jgi:arylsulfatase A-like enzyme
MNHFIRIATILLTCWMPSPDRGAHADDATRPPNVIVILVDDLGSLDTHAYGAEDLETPHLDELAERGVRFTQFYAAAPVCSPSRAGLLTGRYPVRAGMPSNAPPPPLPDIVYEAGMPTEEVTIADMLQAAGYATALVGKWHLGVAPGMLPNDQGFDHTFGHLSGCIDNYSHTFYWHGPNRHDLWRNNEEVYSDGDFFPDLMVAEATQFIESHRDEPFFLYFAMNLPHYPLQGEAHWLERYADLPYPRNLYAAQVSTMDERIGELIAVVDELGLREQTLIIFQSDHGHSVEERNHFGGGYCGPYRGAKFSLFEGGIRVPAIVSLPGTIPEGEMRDQVAHSCDWLPTIADFTGAAVLNNDLDGLSLKDIILTNAPTPHEVLHWEVGVGAETQWAVREGDWKLIGNPIDPTAPDVVLEPLFLSHLKEDVSERTNLAAQHPEVVERLRALHEP